MKGRFGMIRRILCLLCAVLLLVPVFPASAEQSGGVYSYDFDLTFSMNADAFAAPLRTRAAGYATLVERIGIRGNIAWSDTTRSMELNATVYYTDDPSLSYPFRAYGTKSWLFCTSPLINDSILFLDLSTFMEYAVKVKNTLSFPLTYLAFLYPYVTEHAFAGLSETWNNVIGTFGRSGEVSAEQFSRLAGLWAENLRNDPEPQRWIMALSDGSQAPDAVETELNSLPEYISSFADESPVTVTVSEGSEVWKNASGRILFSRHEADGSLSADLSLPESVNGYTPAFSFLRRNDGSSFSFDLAASLRRAETRAAASADDVPALNSSYSGDSDDAEDDAENDEYDEESEEYGEDWDEEADGSSVLPELMLDFHAEGSGFPAELPANSAFTLSSSMTGAAYPNFSLQLQGEAKKDGSLSLSLYMPYGENMESVPVFSCSGTLSPAVPRDIPDYQRHSLEGVYNIFAFNEETLAAFSHEVLPPLVRSLFTFIEAAPTAACQSFLDDITDLGVLDMLLE